MTALPPGSHVPAAHHDSMRIIRRLLFGLYWFFAAVIGLIMVINAGIGGYFMHQTRQFLDHAIRVDATVVRMESDGIDSAMRAPVVEYLDSDQKTHEFQSRIFSNPPAYHVGEKIGVYYSPANPDDARIDSFFSLWLVPLIFGSVAAVMLFPLVFITFLALIIRWALRTSGSSSTSAA